jgi:hypothetical protein
VRGANKLERITKCEPVGAIVSITLNNDVEHTISVSTSACPFTITFSLIALNGLEARKGWNSVSGAISRSSSSTFLDFELEDELDDESEFFEEFFELDFDPSEEFFEEL